ncbi:hypothetical protein BELL_0161g00030 [Botrytis elliptica]|uniref:Uncharacterized protein n=1 Tax=Botrytis elliptica TaxID=278938 RepID=A0A4Z1JXD7_9HELO|nr:hypothetical protein EAE99_012279 [Botrytis elliptica]TGO76330.1 hypothetical protein BELL_0161g00030 [Botrytis elliptica]
MSTIPSRTRSIRKPSERITNLSRPDIKSSVVAAPENLASPSRLPIKPRRTTISTASSTPTSTRPSTTSSIGTSNASIRPPSTRANVTKPPTTAGQARSTSVRNSSAATSEPVKDRSRPPLTSTNRHIRTSSITSATTRPTHLRTNSSSTILNNPSTVLRPPSQTSQRSRPPSQTSQRSRPPSQTSQRAQPQDAPVRARPQSLYGDSSIRKPAFSTLQQHFSPAKNVGSKPHPASFLAAPTPSKLPANIAITAETAKLQNELLQLHLLHRDAELVNRQWKASAKKKLGAKFQSVVKRHDELVRLEVEEAGRINAAAFKEWQDIGTPGWGLEEKIQLLDEVLNEAWNLGEPGGKYARLVRKFEKWVVRCEEILRDRDHDQMLDDEEEIVFIEELDLAWKDECLVLNRKLEGWRDALEDLGRLEKESTMASVVGGLRALVGGMLLELEAMAQIESDAVALEQEWIKSVNGSMEDDNNTPVAGAVWRFM